MRLKRKIERRYIFILESIIGELNVFITWILLLVFIAVTNSKKKHKKNECKKHNVDYWNLHCVASGCHCHIVLFPEKKEEDSNKNSCTTTYWYS